MKITIPATGTELTIPPKKLINHTSRSVPKIRSRFERFACFLSTNKGAPSTGATGGYSEPEREPLNKSPPLEPLSPPGCPDPTPVPYRGPVPSTRIPVSRHPDGRPPVAGGCVRWCHALCWCLYLMCAYAGQVGYGSRWPSRETTPATRRGVLQPSLPLSKQSVEDLSNRFSPYI